MLAKHTRHVHKLHCGVLELVYFSNALLAFDDIKSQVTGTPPPNRPNWLPARDTLLTCQLIPLPTMDRLTTFVLDADIEFSSRVLQQCPYYIAGCERRRHLVYWICWLLRRIISSSSSSHLKNLTINSLYVPLEPIVVLSATIKLLTGLRRLDLGLRCFPWVRLSIQSILLHCCPSLLVVQKGTRAENDQRERRYITLMRSACLYRLPYKPLHETDQSTFIHLSFIHSLVPFTKTTPTKKMAFSRLSFLNRFYFVSSCPT